MKYATIKNYDIANGLGVRVSLFVSGCTHRCKGCFNEIAWDFEYGTPFNEKTENDLLQMLKDPYIRGLTLLGGEPLEPVNAKALLPFLRNYNDLLGKSLWIYTGYTYENLMLRQGEDKRVLDEILSYTEVLVDGPFIEDKKSLMLKFRGSENQRLIDVKKTRKENKIVLYELPLI